MDGIPILGALSDLRTVVERHAVACVILPDEPLPDDPLSEWRWRAIANLCQGHGIAVMRGGARLRAQGLASYGQAS